jgi:hypothetical protein
MRPRVSLGRFVHTEKGRRMTGLLIIALIVAVLWAGNLFMKRMNKP